MQETSTQEQSRMRDEKGRWGKDVSGNPSGRNKTFMRYIREKTKDGQALVDFMLKVFRGDEIDGKKPALKDRLEAANWPLLEVGRGHNPHPIFVNVC